MSGQNSAEIGFKLKGVLPKNFARPELDKRRLGEVADIFTNISIHKHGDSKDILGRAYEYCLGKFAEQEGKLAGEFYIPVCVVKTLVEAISPFNGRVYDPCCGSGDMFVQSAQFIEANLGKAFEEKMGRLTAERSGLFSESRKLEEAR